MTILGLSEDEFVHRLNAHLRPSTPIESFEHLYGRDRQLDQIKETIYSPGRHAFIYGDRGVGKTSLARTAAFKFSSSAHEPVYVACGQDSTFLSVVTSIVDQLRARAGVVAARDTTKTTLGFKGFGVERTIQRDTAIRPELADLNSAAEAIRLLCPDGDRSVIMIDEFERLAGKAEEQGRFAELIKQLGDRSANVALIFCGIGKNLDDLMTAHASAYRYLQGIPLDRLNVGARWEIIDRSSEAVGLRVNDDSRFRISAISDGFPHYVHLLCTKLYWVAFNDQEQLTTLTPEHYIEGVRGACESIESWLRQAYDRATKKDNDVYEEVLWALADHFELERNVNAIHASYLRIMEDRWKTPLGRASFVSSLNNLKGPRHGSILRSQRRSWYEFSESMVRGYVRLRAEARGVRLAIEHEPSAEPKRQTVGKAPMRPITTLDRSTYGRDPAKLLERKQERDKS